MTLYYFLGTLLPELKIGQEPEISFADFLSLMKENGIFAEAFLRFIDIENIRLLLANRPLKQTGNLDANELQESLLVEAGLPDYILQFLDTYEGTEERLKHFSSLFAAFFSEEIPRQTGFLKDWLIQERARRLVLTALRAKKTGRPILEELQFEDANDPLMVDILAQKDAATYTPPNEFGEIEALYQKHQDDPLSLHKAFLEYQFKKAAEVASFQPFSTDRLLAYLFQLYLVEKSLILGAA